jgi:hypothetical protein
MCGVAFLNSPHSEATMSGPLWGAVSGIIFGAISAGSMIPLSFPDKKAALTGAFLNRFAIGVVIGCVVLAWPGWAIGLASGLLLSLPDAIITKAYAPILIFGAVGGTIIGGVIHGWGMPG